MKREGIAKVPDTPVCVYNKPQLSRCKSRLLLLVLFTRGGALISQAFTECLPLPYPQASPGGTLHGCLIQQFVLHLSFAICTHHTWSKVNPFNPRRPTRAQPSSTFRLVNKQIKVIFQTTTLINKVSPTTAANKHTCYLCRRIIHSLSAHT